MKTILTRKSRHELSTEDKRALMPVLAQKYPGHKGSKINWKRAFGEEPLLAKQLGLKAPGKMQKIYQLASDYFRLRAPAAAANGSHVPTPTSAPTSEALADAAAAAAKPDGRATKVVTPEMTELIKTAHKEFPAGRDGVRWAEALRARPEWRTPLKADDKNGMGRLYFWTKKILGTHKRAARSTVAKTQEIQEGQPLIVAGCTFCPACGKNLEMHNQVEATLAQLQHQQMQH